MQIQKFKTYEEASSALWNFNPGKEYFQQITSLFNLYNRVTKFSFPHGVFKYHNLKEAEEHKRSVIKDYL